MKSSCFAVQALFAFIACNKSVEGPTTEFVVKVDSVSHSSFAASNDTITLRFFGTVGSDGCHSFSHFETVFQSLQLDITVWGQVWQSGACPAVMVYLDGKEYKFVPGQMGWYRINVHQPDGSVIRDSIVVK